MIRSTAVVLLPSLALAACSSGRSSCTSNADRPVGESCEASKGVCVGAVVSNTAGSAATTTGSGANSSSGSHGAITAAASSSGNGSTGPSTSGTPATTTTNGGLRGTTSGTTSGASGTTSGGGTCAVACSNGFSCDAVAGLCKTPQGVPQLSNVWIVVMENTSYSDLTSSNAPYIINTLTQQGVLMSNYYAVTHPSLPNYVAMVGGDYFGISNDGEASDPTYQIAASHPDIASQLEDAGLTWHEYSESQLTPCALDDTGSDPTAFASKHDPMQHFLVTQSDPLCQTDDVSYEPEGSMPGMAADIAAGAFYNYVFISPNLCDDGHDSCPPTDQRQTQQDDWLNDNLSPILASPAYQANGLIVVTWDEDDNTGGNNQIMTIYLSPMLATPGQPDGTLYSHYSTLATIEAGFGLPNLPASLGHTDALVTDLWK